MCNIKGNEDLHDVIMEVLEDYGDCSKDMIGAIMYKKVMAHLVDIGRFVKEMERATKDR